MSVTFVRALAQNTGRLLLSILISLVFFGGDLQNASARGDLSAASDPRIFHFTYSVEIPPSNDSAQRLAVWIPLPQSDPGVQHVSDLIITAPGEYRITLDPDFGNSILYFETRDPSCSTRISWSATIERFLDSGQGQEPLNRRFLTANRLIPLNETARALAAELGSINPEHPIEKRAKLIFDDVLNSMEYNKKIPGYGMGDFSRSVSVCKGNCTDFHARFTGLGRVSEIPVRFTMGIPLKIGRNSYNSYHCWAHWFDGMSWQPVDISEADKIATAEPQKAQWYFGHLGTDRIALSWGRDIILDLPQAGGPLNYFVFPYAEVDGLAIPLDKSMWEFSWSDD